MFIKEKRGLEMLEKYSIRTDLALEEKERFEADNVEVQGVVLEEEYDEEKEIRISRVRIETENGAKVMGKPVGTYLTLEAPNLAVPDEGYHREISEKLSGFIRELIEAKGIQEKDDLSVLIVGLGNRQVTPDALGPFVVDNLCVTRHIVKEYGKYAMGMEHANMVSAIVPGVMGQTGMETVEIVKGVIEETKPDIVIAVDALAARNSRRLNRTVQIADTGINPGSGVGNHRNGLTKESLGIPVIAIGVPTVVDAATIVNDTMENLIQALETSDMLKGVGDVLRTYNAAEKYELVKELISPHLNGMFMTPKDVDEMVKQISYTISEGMNMLFTNAKQA
jgi:spore protease